MKFAVSVFGNQPMPQIVERVETIEALGFDAVWFGDLQRICREVYVEMTACALNTSSITLGYRRHHAYHPTRQRHGQRLRLPPRSGPPAASAPASAPVIVECAP